MTLFLVVKRNSPRTVYRDSKMSALDTPSQPRIRSEELIDSIWYFRTFFENLRNKMTLAGFSKCPWTK